MSRKNKMGKVLSAVLSISMLFGMSFPAVKAEDTAICPEQDFESVASATAAGWTWNTDEPTIETNIGNNTGKALTLNPGDKEQTRMTYNFEPTDKFTLKMKLYMDYEGSNPGAYIRFTNADNKSMSVMTCGWNKQIWQENNTYLGLYNIGWNDVEITVDPAQKTYSFIVNDITVAETGIINSGSHSGFFDSAITAFDVIKYGAADTVAIDDFSITQHTGGSGGSSGESPVSEDIDENFDSRSASDLTDGNGVWKWCQLNSNSYLAAYPMCTTISMSGGIAGKTADDKCVVIKGENINSTKGKDPFISLRTGAGNQITTLDFRIYMDGDPSTHIQALNASYKAESTQLIFYPDGSAYFFGVRVDDFDWKTETENSKWMNVSLSMDADTRRTILIINNKIVADASQATGVITAYGYKFVSLYSEDGQNGTLAIDNLRFYEGLPKDYAIGEIRGFSNGNASEKFGVGEYKVKCNVLSYAEELPVMLAIASYGSDGILKQVKVQDYNVSGSQTVEASIDVESADGKLKVFVWNPKTLKSYVNCKTIEPKGEGMVKMFPGFTTKAVTIGFDDGVTTDEDVIKVLDKYGAKATFNIVGSRLAGNYGTTDYASIANVYKNHEIANHTYEHLPSYLTEGETSKDSYGNVLTGCSKQEAINDVLQNKTFLADNLGATTRGIVWPNGFTQDRTDYAEIETVLKENGYVYARYKESGNFDLPTDMMKWAPTCRINTMAQKAEQFVNSDTSEEPKLFYFWGHSYEFKNADGEMDTTSLENVLQTLSQADIWYATNGEAYDYITALSKVTQNEDTIKNNSDMEVYLNVNGKNITLAAGAEYKVPYIVCWGDSLTYGAQSTNPSTKSYPAVLAKLSGAQVENMGIPGETTTTIAARQGVLDIVLSNDITIPESGSVPIEFKASNGGKVAPRDVNIGGWNPCSIDGVEGNLSVEIDLNTMPRVVKSATFTRSAAGESKTVAAGTQIKVAAQEVKGDINIIFSGTNGGWTPSNLTVADSYTNAEEIAGFMELLEKQAKDSLNPDKYVVIGLTVYDNESFSTTVDAAMQQAFGDKFFNLRQALASEQLLTDHGITPTATDMEYIGKGAVPPSILDADGTHFNDTGYQIIAELVYAKLQQLGYIN